MSPGAAACLQTDTADCNLLSQQLFQHTQTMPTNTHLDGPFPVLTELAHITRCNAAHNLGECEAAAVTPLAHTSQQRPQQPALGVEPLLIVLGGKTARETALQVGLAPVGWGGFWW